MEMFFGAFAVMGIVVAFIGVAALSAWVNSQRMTRERELVHTERMKALELRQPLPDADIARASAEATRVRTAGVVGILISLIAVAGSLGATGILLTQHLYSTSDLLTGIWVVCGVIVFLALILSFFTLRRRPQTPEAGRPSPPASRFADSPEAVTVERPSHLPS